MPVAPPRLFALVAFAVGAGAGAAARPPCYTLIDNAHYIETPCSTTLITIRSGDKQLILRAYPQAAAHVVEAAVLIDPGFPFAENVQATADYIFPYFTGINVNGTNLSGSLTAPFTVRPPVVGREIWVGAMALAPSKWPPASAPPAPLAEDVSVTSFGSVVIASVPVVLPAGPQEGDFRAAYADLGNLLAMLPVPGQWHVNVSSPLSPSFSYFFTQRYNGSAFEIEASAEVYFTKSKI